MTVLDELRSAHAAAFRALSAGVLLPPDELVRVLALLAAVWRGLEDDVIGPRLVGLHAKVLADAADLEREALLPGRGRGG